MCGITGFVNFSKDISNSKEVLVRMNHTLKKRGPDEEGYFLDKHICMSHKRLSIIDIARGKQPMTAHSRDNTYTICYNGQLYNTEELRRELREIGCTFDGNSDTEVLLKAYIYWGYNVVHHLNGIFSFAVWDSKKEELFLARDRFGIKPFYYTFTNQTLIFASEVKAILEYPDVEPTLDSDGLHQLMGLGPAHIPGTTLFKGIKELKPAQYAVFNKSDFYLKKYWKLESKIHNDDLDSTCEHVRYLLKDSIQRQLVSDVPLCTLLSGGLDSSIITNFASQYFAHHNLPTLNTYSVDYVDNDIHFVKNDFQPNSDQYYINIMTQKLNTNHHSIMIDTPELANALQDAMIARDCPGMADVDSSLLLFCKEISKDVKVAVSGECADEIFGGYPWFFREDALKSNTFPWSIALDERQKLIHPALSSHIHLKDFVDSAYHTSLNEVSILESDSPETAEKRKIFHLNLNWFMQTLLERSDKMGMYNGLEIRVPFCDYRLVQYVWNIPWEMKAYNGREKGLLRHICSDILPNEIVERKKSPYPKTHNPNYLFKVKTLLNDIVDNDSSPIHQILNTDYIREIIDTDGTAFTKPWFGQLMTGPQLMAYLIQTNMWLEQYQPKIEL